MMELPSGWALCEIADVLHPVEMTGQNEEDRQIFYIDISSIDNQSNRIANPKRIKLSDAPSRARQKVRVGDVLFSTVRPYLRKIAAVDHEFDGEIASTGFAVLRGAAGIEPRYLFYKCISHDFVSALTGEQYGVSYPAVKEEQVKARPLELPPTLEQRRIVERIDALFEEIDRGVESLQTAKTTLALYRHSLLKSAYLGRLTTDWRTQNADKLEPPESLLARIQPERETRYKAALDTWQEALAKWRVDGQKGKKPWKPKRPRDIPAKPSNIEIPGWTMVPLGLLIDEPAYGTSKKSAYGAGEQGVLRIPNIGNGHIDPADLKSAKFEEAEFEQYRLIEGDVLTIRSNGSLSLVGKPALVRAEDTKFIYAGYLIRLRPIPGSLVPKNLVYMMMESGVRAQIETKAKSTSGVNNINAKELQELYIPICSVAEQSEIVRILDFRIEAADALDAEIDAALTRATTLRQSILKKAFSGQLVHQDPTDEAAIILLQRTRAAKDERERTTKRDRKSSPQREPKIRRPKLTDLINVLELQKNWISASKAAEELGISDGASSDDVEAFYRQLKDHVEGGIIDVERRGDADWLRLTKAKVA